MTFEDDIGTTLGSYRIDDVVGQGGMSVVYLAEHVHLGKQVALKVLSSSLARDAAFRERFLRESRIAASLDHANIIPIYDAGEVDGRLYIAMRHVEGSDLKQAIIAEGRLSLAKTIFLMEQVASALDEAHRRGLVHRDVKPENVLIASGTERVYLTDFGIVKHGESTGLTQTGYFLGTVQYAAPEQIEGRPVDARTDVYSVGCIIYEALAGAPPFDRPTAMAMIHAHLNDAPPRISEKRPDLPSTLDGVIGRAMAKEQSARFESCGALVAALRAAAFDSPTGERELRSAAMAEQAAVPAPTLAAASPAGNAPRAAQAAPAEPAPTTSYSVEGGGRGLRVGRRGLLAIVAALLLAGGATAAALALTGGGSDSEDAAMTGEKMANGFPDAIEDELVLAHVPEGIRDDCDRVRVVASGSFLRSVKCPSGARGVRSVTYSRAHSGEALSAYFLSRAERAKAMYPTKGSCAQGRPAANEWVREAQQTHVERPSHAAEGRVLCFAKGGTVTIAWTDTPTKLYGEATAPASNWPALYSWWKEDAGPEKERASMMDGGEMAAAGAYPDAIEEELLRSHVPASFRKTCRRASDFDATVFLRAITCKQAKADYSVEYMYAHSVSALRVFSDNQITGAGLNFPTSKTCQQASAAADSWVRRGDAGHMERRVRAATGRVLCYVSGDTQWLEWSDWPLVIYARASRPAAKRGALYAWWSMNGGPGPLESGMGGGGSM